MLSKSLAKIFKSVTNISLIRRHSHKIGFHPDVVPDLAAIVGAKNVLTAAATREQYGRDEGPHTPRPTDAVVRPASTRQVSDIVRYCHDRLIPVIPFGAGSGVEGGTIPLHGGITLDMCLMDKVLEVHAEDFDVVVEPGISRKTLNNYLRDTGLWFPVDPGADATIGGMSSTSASGTNAVRYGTMRENVLNLEVVLADGTVLHTAGPGHRPKKTSAGYNLTNLFVGSEGTLGIFTKIHLRLHAVPEMITSAVCTFPTVGQAVTTAIETLQANIPIARVELVDAFTINACNRYSKVNYKEAPTLFFEFHGSKLGVEEQTKAVGEISSSNGGSEFLWTKEPEERNKLWNARHSVMHAILALKPGTKFVVSDTCVPISQLPKAIEDTQKDIESHGIIGSIVGHVGEGNFHCIMLYDSSEQTNQIKAISDRMASRAWAVGGTCTGEHGIGLGKMHLLEGEVGKEGVNAMKLIKRSFDPLNILNPGKVVNI